MNRLTRLSVLALMLSLGGCASWFDSDVRDPELHLLRVETVKARLMQQRFILHFRLDNPNDSALQMRGLSYSVHLDELLLAQGDHEQWLRVDPHGQRLTLLCGASARTLPFADIYHITIPAG